MVKALELLKAQFSVCPQVSSKTGVQAARRLAQNGTTGHSCVALLTRQATMCQGLSWHTVLVCMAVMYGGGAGVELPRTPSSCSRERRH